jgi:S1-C subfamily serine protease
MNNMTSSLDILKTFSDATVELIGSVSPSVVSVSLGMGGGTGVVWSSDGYIVTCNHVVGRSRKTKVGLGNGNDFDAKLVGRDPYSDVALLKIEAEGLKHIELGDSEKISVGEFVIALANPFNRQPAATSGMVTNVRTTLRGMRGMNMENVIVTDAKLNPGYSGGPVVDASGKMIGINAAFAWGRGIAIPISTVKDVVERLMKGGTVKRAYLGVLSNTFQIPQEVAQEAKLEQDSGVMILSVEQGSPARKAGLAFADIIVRFNDKPVTNVYDLPRALTEDVVGKKSKISVLRGEKLVELTATPTEAKAAESD